VKRLLGVLNFVSSGEIKILQEIQEIKDKTIRILNDHNSGLSKKPPPFFI